MSAELLQRAIAALRDDQPLSDEIRHWLEAGLSRFWIEERDLELHLGLRLDLPPGSKEMQPVRLAKRGLRNQLIQDIAGQLPGDTSRARAKELARLVRRYPGCLEDMDPPLADLVDRLMHGDVQPPGSTAQIKRILDGESVPERSGYTCDRRPTRNAITGKW